MNTTNDDNSRRLNKLQRDCLLGWLEVWSYSYLIFRRLKKHMLNASHKLIDPDDFFVNFHEDCHSYYDSLRLSHAFFVYNVVLDSLFCHVLPMVVVMFSMEIFVVEIRKMIRKRQEMNFVGKQIRVFNAGTIMYIIQSSSITIRHSFMVFTSVFIWYNDKDNIFLTSTLQEQFLIYRVVSVVSILLANLLLLALMNLGRK